MKIYAVLVLIMIALPLPRLEAAEAAKSCPVGVYRFADGRTVDIASSDDHTLRWLMFTGERGQLHPQPDGTWTSTFGWTGRSDGKKVSFSKCDAGEIRFDHQRGTRVDFDVHDSSEPWYKDVHGDFLFFILPLDQAQIIDAMTKDLNFVAARTPFRYEPMPTLEASTTPQLWILGSDDLEAPSAETAKRIKSLIAQGKPYTLAVYPGAEHGMTEYEIDAKGDRVSTRFAPAYFQMMADFVRDGRINDHYGNAAIDPALRSGR